MSQSFKIALCQLAVVDDKAKNIQKAAEMVKKAAEQGCRMAILPEMFNCPYQSELFPKYAETYPYGESIKRLAALAREQQILLVGGSIPERDGNSIYNTCFIFDTNGVLIGRHRKVHLFDVDINSGNGFRESDTLTAGQDITVVTGNGITFGVAICYDIRFAELARAMTDKGASIIIYPAAFGRVTGPAHWELLFRTRAVDNQVFAIGVGPARTPGAKYQAYGHSIVTDPWGRVLTQADYDEALLMAELDLSLINKVRKELPLLKHRRPEIYKKLTGEVSVKLL